MVVPIGLPKSPLIKGVPKTLNNESHYPVILVWSIKKVKSKIAIPNSMVKKLITLFFKMFSSESSGYCLKKGNLYIWPVIPWKAARKASDSVAKSPIFKS